MIHIIFPQWNGTWIDDALIKNVEPFVDHWITVGDAQMREKLSPRYGIEMVRDGKPRYTAIRNGITLEPDFTPIATQRDKYSFVYCSCPTRGLWKLLEKWSLIKQKLPEATLSIYYNKTDETAKQFEPYANDPSITYVGKVNQATLFEKLKRTEYWVYFCNYESCCTTAIEMAYYGTIAICNPAGGLAENVCTEGLIREDDPDVWYDKALDMIVKLENSPEYMTSIRQQQFDWTVNQTWDNRIPQWRNMLESI